MSQHGYRRKNCQAYVKVPSTVVSVEILSKIEVLRDVRNSKRSIDMTRSGMNGLNIRTNASPKWDRTQSAKGCNSALHYPYWFRHILASHFNFSYRSTTDEG